MCTQVEFDGKGYAGSVNGLRSYGVVLLPEDDDDEPRPGDACLCGVDVGAALDRAGFGWKYDAVFDIYSAVSAKETNPDG